MLAEGRRVALHHMITDGDRGYAAWRDGGFTIHDKCGCFGFSESMGEHWKR